MIDLLIYLLILIIVFAVVAYIINLIPMPGNWRMIVQAILGLILLLVVLDLLLGVPGLGLHRQLLR